MRQIALQNLNNLDHQMVYVEVLHDSLKIERVDDRIVEVLEVNALRQLELLAAKFEDLLIVNNGHWLVTDQGLVGSGVGKNVEILMPNEGLDETIHFS